MIRGTLFLVILCVVLDYIEPFTGHATPHSSVIGRKSPNTPSTALHATNTAQEIQRRLSSTALKASKMAQELQRKLKSKMERAKLSSDIYMNPATKKLGNVTISWEPNAAKQIVQIQKNRGDQTRPLMVGVVGIPGSGKSTSSDILASLLENSIVMPMDGYHYSMEKLREFPDPTDVIYRRGAPDTFDTISLQKDLERIVHGEEDAVSIPGFDHAKGDPEKEKHTFVRNQHKIVICEGIYLMHQDDGWDEIKNYFDWTIYISVDVDKCIDRLKERNKCIPGYTPEEIDIRCDAVDRVNAETVERSRKYANEEVVSGAA